MYIDMFIHKTKVKHTDVTRTCNGDVYQSWLHAAQNVDHHTLKASPIWFSEFTEIQRAIGQYTDAARLDKLTIVLEPSDLWFWVTSGQAVQS